MLTSNAVGPQRFTFLSVACPNPDCKRLTVSLSQAKLQKPYVNSTWQIGEELKHWRLLPISTAKVLPPYVPSAITSDYEEACLIAQYSPKASATLARRCIQGMIRDFFTISKPRLIDEIEAIKAKVDPLTWAAIDAVRSIGNIGAHMEKDINLIIEVDQDEAQQLIRLIELLVEEWYVQRHVRQEQLNAILEIKASKDATKHLLSTSAEKTK